MMKYLVGGIESEHLLELAQIPTGVRTLLGDTEGVDSAVQPEVMSAHIELKHAAGKVAALANDPTRSVSERHVAAKKVSDTLVDKLSKTGTLLTKRSEALRKDALTAADEMWGPKADRAAIQSEVRAWIREKAKTPEGLVAIRKAIETEPVVAEGLWHSPTVLLDLPATVHSNLRLEGLEKYRPDLFAKLSQSADLATLAEKFAKVARKVPGAFYSPELVKVNPRRVDVGP